MAPGIPTAAQDRTALPIQTISSLQSRSPRLTSTCFIAKFQPIRLLRRSPALKARCAAEALSRSQWDRDSGIRSIRPTQKHLAARTVRHIAGVLNVALNKAFKLDLLPMNPMLQVELPTVQKKEAQSLSPDGIQALPYLATAAHRGELPGLQWADLDWVNGTLTISKSLERRRRDFG
jgi:integrase